MSDPNIPPTFDPTESTRIIREPSFTERNVTLREHQDTDKHYIGDALPVPSPESVAPTTLWTAVGESPFPARADHSHAFRGMYSTISSTGMKIFPPGRFYWNNLQWTGYGRNMMATSQIINIPMDGLWRISCNFLCARTGGGNLKNEMNIIFAYNNGATEKNVFRTSNFDLPNNVVVAPFDEIILAGATKNVQIAIEHNDEVTWECYNQGINVIYVCPLESN